MNDNLTEQRAAAAPSTERRTYGTGELRVSGSGTAQRITGLAAAYGVLSEPLGFGRERLIRGSFSKVLASNPDTTCLWNHDRNSVLGRTPDTLKLWETDAGLHFECTLPDTQLARELATLIQRGDVRGCSFAFTCTKERWTTGEGGEAVREVLEVGSLDDVSVVLRPAYLATSVQARRLEAEAARHRSAPMTTAQRRQYLDDLKAKIDQDNRRHGYRPSAAVASERQAIEAIRAQRAHLERMARTDPAWRWNTEQANRREQRRRAEGNLPGAVLDRGVLVAPW